MRCLHSPAWKSMPTARDVPDTGTRASDLSSGSRGIPRMPSCTEYSKKEPIPNRKHRKTGVTILKTRMHKSSGLLSWKMFLFPCSLIKSLILIVYSKNWFLPQNKKNKKPHIKIPLWLKHQQCLITNWDNQAYVHCATTRNIQESVKNSCLATEISHTIRFWLFLICPLIVDNVLVLNTMLQYITLIT